MTGKIQRWAKAELLCAVLGAAALGGCTGQVGGGSPGPGTNVAPPGAGGTGSNTGSGGSGSAGTSSTSMGPPATDPGRVTMHRLNLAEYDNTMRDLLGSKTHPSR